MLRKEWKYPLMERTMYSPDAEILAPNCGGWSMIWTFERNDEVVRLETRIDNITGEYLLVCAWAERSPEMERFRDRAEFEFRIRALEAYLAADQWSQVGDPTILSDGWRGPVAH